MSGEPGLSVNPVFVSDKRVHCLSALPGSLPAPRSTARQRAVPLKQGKKQEGPSPKDSPQKQGKKQEGPSPKDSPHTHTTVDSWFAVMLIFLSFSTNMCSSKKIKPAETSRKLKCSLICLG